MAATVPAPAYQLAQMNVARMRGPLTDPVMGGFVARLDEINALADSAPGFVWRMAGHGEETSAALAAVPVDPARPTPPCGDVDSSPGSIPGSGPSGNPAEDSHTEGDSGENQHPGGMGSGHDPVARLYPAEFILVNLSVWEAVEPLQRFVYHSDHGKLLRDRREWFERFEGRWSVLWWVPAGHRPGVAEGKTRLDHLRAHGETAHAFNFKQPFPAPTA